MAVIEVHDVHKTYRRRRRPPKAALDGLDLSVEAGGVHGFLGPNGSGKTTLLRCLMGLAKADSGEMSILGRPTPKALPTVVGDVGSLLESPAFFPPYSGRLNLSLLATAQRLPRTRVDEVLQIVGLTDAADDRVKGYSLGMRQRLGIAAAMLNQTAGARARRTEQRSRPGRHEGGPAAASSAGRPGHHGAVVVAPAQRGATDLRPGHDRQPRPTGHLWLGQRSACRAHRQPPSGSGWATPAVR